MPQTFTPIDTYGSSDVKNRVKPGNTLGSNQYFYKTNASTGKITVNRYTENKTDGAVSITEIGTIPQGGSFTPSSDASSAEKTYYNSTRNIGRVRQQALQVARREWDGRTQPPPHQAIYGINSGNIGYNPAGSGTADSSVKGIQETGYSTISESPGRALLGNTLGAIAGQGLSGGISSLLGGRRGGGGGSGQVMVYPVTLRRTGNAQDYIQITELEHAPKQRTGMTWGGRTPPNKRTLGSVILPIPGGINDANSVGWGQDTMDPAQTAMANLALTGINEGFDSMVSEAGNIGNQLKNNDKKTKDAISTTIAGMASGTGAQLLTRTTGAIMNPNMELLFKNPSLRPFSFTWKLAARSRQEANVIISIINFFKKGMAVKNDGDGLFLMSPNTWKLQYKNRGRDHKYLNKFKECAMTSLTTQYTPDGNYATFETGHMVSYSITMGLQELEPVFSSDYGKGGDEIGY